MDLDSETSSKIQELQSLEQQLQNFLMQKQSMQVESNESANALNEVKKADDEIYKIVSGIMIKIDKNTTIKDLEEKVKVLDLRITSIEKQEKLIEERAEKLRKEINDAVSKKTKDKN